ncbi:MAG: hypothetical protein FIB01_06180 [Gemmatimonadetes bacterium]|nr:hypothetical protein [Gemmatimonadota bacterium]
MKMWVAALVGAVLLAGAAVRPAAAQSREDSAAVWLDAARQLRSSGQPGAADALLELLRRRFAGTAASVDADRLLAVSRAQPEPERPGRTELLVWGTTYGAWLGIALPVIAEADEPEIFGLGLLAGAPLGFLAANGYARSHAVTEGQARAITFGGSFGSWQGFGWTQVLLSDEKCQDSGYCYSEDPEARTMVAGSVIGGLAGVATGALMARKPISSGVATAVSSAGPWGSWFGLAAGVLLGLEDNDLLAATLIGGDAGIAAMAALAPKWNPTRSRARLVSLGGLVGGLAGGGLDLIIQPDDEKVAIMIPAVGSAAGLLIAANSMKERGSDGQSNAPSAVGGALLEYRQGGVEIGMPAVGLRLQRDRQQKAQTALYVPVLEARF